MWILTCWLVIMGAAGLFYPRRPRTAGTLFLVAGSFLCVMWAVGAIGGFPVIAAMPVALGLGYLWRFRDPATRAEHVAEWTAKA